MLDFFHKLKFTVTQFFICHAENMHSKVLFIFYGTFIFKVCVWIICYCLLCIVMRWQYVRSLWWMLLLNIKKIFNWNPQKMLWDFIMTRKEVEIQFLFTNYWMGVFWNFLTWLLILLLFVYRTEICEVLPYVTLVKYVFKPFDIIYYAEWWWRHFFFTFKIVL